MKDLHLVRVLRLGAGYFTHVFLAGFLLGVIRTAWVEPHTGAVTAELLEAPLMLVVIYLAARTRVQRTRTITAWQWLAAGGTALVLLVGIELAVAAWLRGLSPAQYIAGRDALAGGVYVALLIVFAVMPWLLRRRLA